jgi:hypothetical protein
MRTSEAKAKFAIFNVMFGNAARWNVFEENATFVQVFFCYVQCKIKLRLDLKLGVYNLEWTCITKKPNRFSMEIFLLYCVLCLKLRHYQIVTCIVTASLAIKLLIFREYICEECDSGFGENAAYIKTFRCFGKHCNCVFGGGGSGVRGNPYHRLGSERWVFSILRGFRSSHSLPTARSM